MKPFVHILKYGSPGKPITDEKLGACSEIHSTVGLIVYEKAGVKKGMVVDCGVGADWQEIERGIIGVGLRVVDITHVLLTHLHQDHIQNLKEFADAIVVTGGQAAYLDRPGYGAGGIYKDGIIEIPEIAYIKAPIAHTYRDTVYVVDSANSGKVAFLGDLIFATEKYMSLKDHIVLDKSVSADPIARYLFVRDLLNTLPDVERFYAGHNSQALDREGLKKYSESLSARDFQKHLKEWHEGRVKEMNEEYKKFIPAE